MTQQLSLLLKNTTSCVVLYFKSMSVLRRTRSQKNTQSHYQDTRHSSTAYCDYDLGTRSLFFLYQEESRRINNRIDHPISYLGTLVLANSRSRQLSIDLSEKYFYSKYFCTCRGDLLVARKLKRWKIRFIHSIGIIQSEFE